MKPRRRTATHGRVRAVTFDAAGTLFTVAEAVGRSYGRLAERHGIQADAARLDAAFREEFAASPPLAFPGIPPERLSEAERGWWSDLVRRTFARAGAELDESRSAAAFAEIFAHFAHAGAWRVDPDAVPALEALRARSLRLAVVSNFDTRLFGLLAELGLGDFFQAVVTSTQVGAAKPDGAIFAAALAALGVRPEEALHVGDDPIADVEGARCAGLHAVAIERRRGGALGTIASLVELVELVGREGTAAD